MSVPTAPASADPPSDSEKRVAGQAASEFLLDMLEVVSRGVDLLDAVLLLAIMQANVTQVSNDRELQWRYAAAETPPPDELRRPISVTALAASLMLPFETVRRRLGNLANSGLCEATERGYRVPARVLHEPRFVNVPAEIFALLQRLEARLAGAPWLPAPANGPPGDEVEPVRIAARLCTDYFLRMLTLISGRAGDPVGGFALVALFVANAPAADGAPTPDHRLRPVSTATVARRLRMAHETLRRRMLALEAKGFCERVSGGWIMPAESLERLRHAEALDENIAHLRLLFSSLARLGVSTRS